MWNNKNNSKQRLCNHVCINFQLSCPSINFQEAKIELLNSNKHKLLKEGITQTLTEMGIMNQQLRSKIKVTYLLFRATCSRNTTVFFHRLIRMLRIRMRWEKCQCFTNTIQAYSVTHPKELLLSRA